MSALPEPALLPACRRTLRPLPQAGELKRQAFQAMPEDFKRERNRKHLYIQSTKLARSKQLGIDYQRVIEAQL